MGEAGTIDLTEVLAGYVPTDSFFGGGNNEATSYQPGEKVTLRDDSGATMNFTPFHSADAINESVW